MVCDSNCIYDNWYHKHREESMHAHERKNIRILIHTYRLWKLGTTATISYCQVTILCNLNGHGRPRSISIGANFRLTSSNRYRRRTIWYVDHVCSRRHSSSCWNRIYERWREYFGSWIELKFLKECHKPKIKKRISAMIKGKKKFILSQSSYSIMLLGKPN